MAVTLPESASTSPKAEKSPSTRRRTRSLKELLLSLYEDTDRLLVTPSMLETPEDLPLGEKDVQAMQTLERWIRVFITQMIEKSPGHWEAICPAMPAILESDSLFLTVARPTRTDVVADLYHEVLRYKDLYHRLIPSGMTSQNLKTFVILFPETPGHLLPQVTDPKNTPLKTLLINDGMMMGEFYPECPYHATWDPDFFPLQSPVPFLVMRPLIENDWRFIHREAPWRAAYKEHFGRPRWKYVDILPYRVKMLLRKFRQR